MFDRPINIEHNQKNILTADENYHGTQHIKRNVWYLTELIYNFLKKGLQTP